MPILSHLGTTKTQSADGPWCVLVVSEYLPLRGGTTSQTRLHAIELNRAGRTPVVLTRKVPGSPRAEHLEGIRIERIGVPGRGTLVKLVALAATGLWLRRRRRHVSVLNVMLDPDFAIVARAAGVKDISLTWVTAGDPSHFLSGSLGLLRRRWLQNVYHVVLTPTMRDELQSFGFQPAVIPVPVDPVRFPVAGPQAKRRAREQLSLGDEQILLFVGHLQYRKGVDLLLEALCLLPDATRSVRLLVVGEALSKADRVYEERLRRIASRPELRGRIIFCGPRDDVALFFQAADIFCLPSRREGMPNVLLEAMASGLPCVAPPSAGGSDLLSGDFGVVPRFNCPEDLAEAIATLLASPLDAKAKGDAAAAAVRSRYSPDLVAREYERLWSSRGGRTPAPAKAPECHGSAPTPRPTDP